MKKENQRVTITKRLLKESLLRLIRKKEIDHITITELCSEAEINRATFYRHYTTPKDVLIDIEFDMLYEIKERCGTPKSLPEIKKYLDEMCRYMYEHADLICLLLECNSYTDFVNLLNEFYSFVVAEQSSTNPLLGYDEDSLKLITTYFAGGGYFLMRQWLTEDIHKTPEEISDLIWGLFQITSLKE